MSSSVLGGQRGTGQMGVCVCDCVCVCVGEGGVGGFRVKSHQTVTFSFAHFKTSNVVVT